MSLLKPRKPRAPVTVQPPVTAQPANAPAVFEERLLRMPELTRMVGLGKSTIYTLIRNGRFPPSCKHTAHVSVWKLSDVQAYIRGEYAPATATVLTLVRNTKGGAK
ncbi:AlpA family phage regulatory protein [Thiothrix sp.]|jgi:prophage regulatory protein|uniref:helix-turn-helix transcriptional regulator n=1 Tax=Thiothrix sp. TaxID=1032 RepID=UPI00257EE777|nr:AlpA family phage regulatory protein [Thiothrix sp.]